MEQTLSPSDYGFELSSEPKLEPNLYNVGGNQCKSCPIKDTCLLARKHYESMCFEGLQKALTQTDVCRKALNKEENVSPADAALHLYVDSFLYHLDHLSGPATNRLDSFTLLDIRSDCAVDSNLTPKYAIICRCFGRQAIDVLRERGYKI